MVNTNNLHVSLLQAGYKLATNRKSPPGTVLSIIQPRYDLFQELPAGRAHAIQNGLPQEFMRKLIYRTVNKQEVPVDKFVQCIEELHHGYIGQFADLFESKGITEHGCSFQDPPFDHTQPA